MQTTRFVAVAEEKLPVLDEVEVLVCGGGPGGMGAALAAHRLGGKVLLVEQNGFIGGMCAYGCGMPLGGAYPAHRSIGGIAEELLEATRNAGKDAASVREVGQFSYWFFHDSEYFKSMFAALVLREKLPVLLHTWACTVLTDRPGHVTGVVVENKSGRGVILADTVVDATGDADLCARAGASFDKGRDTDGAMMALTIPFILGGVDTEAFMAYRAIDPNLEKAMERAEAMGMSVSREDKFSSIHLGQRPGTLFCNSVRVRNRDGSDAADLTVAELEGRVRVLEELQFFRACVPGCGDAWIASSGSQIGIRDTRRIHGEARLTVEDCLTLRKRPDGILHCAGPFDNTTRGSENSTLNRIDETDWYDIPYGALLPVGLDNICIAGRSFCSDYLAHSGSRGQGLLMGMGQAAGTACLMAARQQKPLRELDVAKIRESLIAQGCDVL